MMKLKNLLKAIHDQMPLKRFARNLFKGHLLGLIHKRSHYRETGQAKVGYGSKESALKAAEKMKEKHQKHFSVYKCIWCDGYHLGKNRENK